MAKFKLDQKKIVPIATDVAVAGAGVVAGSLAENYLAPHVAKYGGRDTANAIVGLTGGAMAIGVTGNDKFSKAARQFGFGMAIKAAISLGSKYVVPLFTKKGVMAPTVNAYAGEYTEPSAMNAPVFIESVEADKAQAVPVEQMLSL